MPESFLRKTAGMLREYHLDIGTIILGMHAREDNPELKKALELGLKVYSFPEFLYERSRKKKRVVIGGSHGKNYCNLAYSSRSQTSREKL